MDLKNIVLALGGEWQVPAGRLTTRLARQNRELCVRVMNKRQAAGLELLNPDSGIRASDSIIFTDDRSLAARWAARGFVCIGCAPAEGAFFDGAVLVTDDLDSLGASELEENLLHAQGRPVTIARTARLVLREIVEEDFARLYEISIQEEARHAIEDSGGNCFEPERLSAYIRHVYRFYGYGLWSVLLADGTLIGCCGFRELPSDAGQLELQYMVAQKFRRKGFGTEMCRAALDYVILRTGQDTVWVRIRPENEPSLRLAKKLGFAYNRTGKDGLLLFSLRVCPSETVQPPGEAGAAGCMAAPGSAASESSRLCRTKK